MKRILILVISIGLIMLMGLIYGLIYGNLREDGFLLFTLVWGKIAILDVYVGFFLFGIWIYFREQNVSRFLIWFITLLCIGNLISVIYIVHAMHTSEYDFRKVMLGNYKS